MSSSLPITMIKSIAVVLAGLFFVNMFNLFEHIEFVPCEYTFEAGITAYCTILECIVAKIQNSITTKLEAKIECIFYCDKDSKSIKNTPMLHFVDDVAYIRCLISVKGSASRLRRVSLQISFPDWVGVQNINNTILSIDDYNHLCKVDLSKLISKNDELTDNATVDFKIGLIRYNVDNNYSITIAPKLSSKALLKFSHNVFELKNNV